MIKMYMVMVILALVSVGCESGVVSPQKAQDPASASFSPQTTQSVVAPSPTPVPSPSASPLPLITPSPTPTPSPSPTPTPSPTLTPDPNCPHPYSGGLGSPAHPYLIASTSDFLQIVDCMSDSFALSQDLNFQGVSFLPVGAPNQNSAFSGSFDGQGHIISNISYSVQEPYVALFRRVTGSISNVTVSSSNFTGSNNIGSIIGQNMGHVESVQATGTTVSGHFQVGGLVGINSGDILHSSFSGTVVGLGASPKGDGVGGIAGNHIAGTIAEVHANASINADGDVGGVVGVMSASNNQMSGATLSNAFAVGSITSFHPINMGGLIGTLQYGVLSDSYAAVRLPSIAGTNLSGLVGAPISGAFQLTASYWDTQVSGTTQSGGAGVGLTTGQMQGMQSNYSAWDFASTWLFALGSYPSLR